MSSFLAGFRQQIPRIIGELCAEVEIAPSQLTLPSWGLMNAIQVLSDLSGIFVTGLMVAGAFRVEETAFNSRRFELLPRSGARSPVLIPDWLNPSEEGGHYIYVLHRGPLAISRSWSPPGFVPPVRHSYPVFPDVLFDLDRRLRDPRFLLSTECIYDSSLVASFYHPFEFV
ncbi:unnamed protein product, partial [Arabis nemorensis]